MRTLTLATAFMLAALFGAPAFAVESESCAQLAATVEKLGVPWELKHEDTIRELHQCGTAAVPLLIEQLRVVDPDQKNAAWEHAVWCERALRSITGQYFTFKSTDSLSQLAEFKSQDDDLGYVMEWMSHARVYIAPRDVQEQVISAWRAWLKEHGSSYQVAPFDSYGQWYW